MSKTYKDYPKTELKGKPQYQKRKRAKLQPYKRTKQCIN